MGFLHCNGISTIFVDYLKNVGPVSIKELCARFYNCHDGDMGMDRVKDPKAYQEHAEWALEVAVLEYLGMGLIKEACSREESLAKEPIMTYLTCHMEVPEEEAARLLQAASPSQYVNLVIASHQWDGDGNWIWFDEIVWQMSEKARKDPDLLTPFAGVDT